MERGIGQLKRRFYVLGEEIRVTPPMKVCQIVEVCALLHNICKDRNIPLPEEVPAFPYVPVVPRRRPGDGGRYRDEFCNLHFG